MPRTGGPINRPKPAPKPKPAPVAPSVASFVVPDAPKPKPAPTTTSPGRRQRDIAKKDFHDKPIATDTSGGARVRGHRGGSNTGVGKVDKPSIGGGRGSNSTPGSGGKTTSQKRNAKQFGFKDTTPVRRTRPKPSGGTAGGGGGGGAGGGDRFRQDHTTIAERGGNDGGRLDRGFRDGDIVGSENTITEFDGSEFSGGGFDETGGGGGSGSALAGREAVGRVGQLEGQSLEEVVYGVKKRGRKVGRARGE